MKTSVSSLHCVAKWQIHNLYTCISTRLGPICHQLQELLFEFVHKYTVYWHVTGPFGSQFSFLEFVGNAGCQRRSFFFLILRMPDGLGHQWGSRTVLVSSISLHTSSPSLWGVFVYTEITCSLINRLPAGKSPNKLQLSDHQITSPKCLYLSPIRYQSSQIQKHSVLL